MKLRMRGQSIRLRLTQGDVARLVEEGRVAEKTLIAGAWFVFALVRDDAPTATGANVGFRVEGRDAFLEVHVPAAEVRDWARSERVAMNTAAAHTLATPVELLVEKDFACLKPRDGEDDTDAFPNPTQGNC